MRRLWIAFVAAVIAGAAGARADETKTQGRSNR
jgi:hypothetical protein